VVEDISPPPAVCVPQGCPNTFVGADGVTLSAAGNFAVLELGDGTFSMSGPKTLVDGNVGIGPLGTGQFNAGTVTGEIIVDPTGTLSKVKVPNGGIVTQPLNQAVTDATTASANAAALPPTQTFSADVTTSLTLVSTGALNVINFEKKLALSNKTLTLSGGANDVFILNIFGQFKFDGGSKVVLQGGLGPENVLFNIIGPGDTVKISGGLDSNGIPKTQLIGTVLAVERTVDASGSMVTGEIISAEDIHIDSGTRVICPVPLG
jgi:choice-of-anchor A domain-containing protein